MTTFGRVRSRGNGAIFIPTSVTRVNAINLRLGREFGKDAGKTFSVKGSTEVTPFGRPSSLPSLANDFILKENLRNLKDSAGNTIVRRNSDGTKVRKPADGSLFDATFAGLPELQSDEDKRKAAKQKAEAQKSILGRAKPFGKIISDNDDSQKLRKLTILGG